MSNSKMRKQQTQKLVFAAILTAMVIVLQYISMAMRFGTFSITLTLVPIVIGAATCGIGIGGWLGFVFGVIVLLIAVVIMCSYNNSVKIKMTTASFVLLFICGFASGIADFSQKLFIKNQPDGSAVAFNFYTYIFAALVLFISFALTHKKDISTDKINIKKILSYLIIMAICLFLNSYFKTLAASRMNAIILYPLSQGCALILATLMSVILFKEKLTKKGIVGIVTAFIGLLIINLL